MRRDNPALATTERGEPALSPTRPEGGAASGDALRLIGRGVGHEVEDLHRHRPGQHLSDLDVNCAISKILDFGTCEAIFIRLAWAHSQYSPPRAQLSNPLMVRCTLEISHSSGGMRTSDVAEQNVTLVEAHRPLTHQE